MVLTTVHRAPAGVSSVAVPGMIADLSLLTRPTLSAHAYALVTGAQTLLPLLPVAVSLANSSLRLVCNLPRSRSTRLRSSRTISSVCKS